MTKKEKAIAKAIKEVNQGINEYWYQAAIQNICGKLAVVFKDDNPRFDIQKFLIACGVIQPQE